MVRKSFYEVFWGNLIPLIQVGVVGAAFCLAVLALVWVATWATDNQAVQVGIVLAALAVVVALVKSVIDWKAQQEELECELRYRMKSPDDTEF